MSVFRLSAAAMLALTSVATGASETSDYYYDALGRLVKVAQSGTINPGSSACYAYDPAGNRTNVTVGSTYDCSGYALSSNGPVTEGGNAVFRIQRTGGDGAPGGNGYVTIDQTAVAPNDYTAYSGTIYVSYAQNFTTLTIPTNDDAVVEPREEFRLTMRAPDGTIIGSATALIDDNEAGAGVCNTISFAANDVSISEGGSLVFTVSKSGTTTSTCSVNYATMDVSAVAPGDYAITSGTLVFLPTDASKTVSVATVNSNPSESTEIMYLNLSGPASGAAISDSQGVGTIYNPK